MAEAWPGLGGLAELRAGQLAGEEVSRALEFATRGADADALGFAIDQAFRAGTGICEEALDRAMKRKAALENQAAEARRQRARLEAGRALLVASSMGNVDLLASAIVKAEEAGLSCEEELEAARRQRTAMAAAARRQRLAAEAVRAVRAAVRDLDAERISSSLLRAMKAGASQEAMKQAAIDEEHRISRKDTAAFVLQCAAKVSSVDLLDLTLGWAMAEGVTDSAMAAAREKLAVLAEVMAEDAQRDHMLAEAARSLACAWQQADPQVFAGAIERARTAGISEEMVQMAEKRRAKLQQDQQREGLRQAAEVELRAAVHEADVTALAVAIDRGKEAGLNTDAIDKAQTAKERLEDALRRQQACAEAAKALKVAMLQGGAEALAAAVEAAVQAGVSREVVARARRKLARVRPPPSAEDEDASPVGL